MSITTRTGQNYNYSTASSLIDVNGDIIKRDGLSSNSSDVISVDAIDLMNGYLNSTSVDYNGSSFTVTIQNASTLYSITQYVGTFDATLVLPGTGYSDASGVPTTTAGVGTGLTVDITQTGGIIDTVVINNPGSGYLVGETLTITTGDNNATFTLSLIPSGITMQPNLTYVIPPEGSATFTFVKDSATDMIIIVKDSGILYSPVGVVNDNAIVRFDGTNGSITKNSSVLISNTAQVTGVLSLGLLEPVGTDSITLAAPSLAASYTLTFPATTGTLGQVLSTNGSGVTSWVPNTSPDSRYYGFGPGTAVALTATPTVVVLTDSSITGANYSNTGGVVTITAAGTYEFSYTAQFESLNNTGGATGSFAAQLIRSAGGLISGTVTECYIQETNGNLHRPSCSKTLYAVMAAGATIELQVFRSAGTTTGQTRVNQCTLTITQVA